MEELFVENFFKQHRHERASGEGFQENVYQENRRVEDSVTPFDHSLSKGKEQTIHQKKSDLMLDMGIFLRRLENEIEREYADFADYRFIFNRIRTAFKQNSVEGVIEQLDNLEELLDLALPSLFLKKSLI